MSKLVAAYARISQDKTGAGLAVERQLEDIEAYCAERGLTITETYVDNDVSATKGKRRQGFEDMLADKPKAVVVWHQDRLLRISKDLERVLDTGMTVYQVKAGTLDLATPSGRAVARTVTAWATYEGEQKAERQKAQTRQAAKAGKYRGVIRPFGQELDGTWVEDEAEAVREAAEKIMTGEWSFFRTGKEWNAQGLLPPKSGRQGGRPWTSGTVSLFFSRPRLMGYQDYEGERYKLEGWKPLLTEKQWYAIQALRDSKKTGKRGGFSGDTGSTHMLTKIAVCGECGRGMNVAYRGGTNNLRYYRCPTVGHTTVNSDKLETYVAFEAYILLLAQDTSAEEKNHEERSERLAQLQTEKLALVKDHEVWVNEALTAGMSPSLIQSKVNMHTESVEAMDAEIVKLRDDLTHGFRKFPTLHNWKQDGSKSLAEFWGKAILDMPREAQRDLMRTLFRQVVVKPVTQGVRFKPDRVELVLTDYAVELRDRPTSTRLDWDRYWVDAG